MRLEEVRQFLGRRPFQAVRITLTDGRTYDVHRHEMAMVGWSEVSIGLPRPGRDDDIFDRLIIVSLAQIMQIEPLESATAS